MELSYKKTEINRSDLNKIKSHLKLLLSYMQVDMQTKTSDLQSFLRNESDFSLAIYGNYDFSKVNEIVGYVKNIEKSDMREITFTDPKAVKSWKGS
jgi:hypothetical protein|tara:strand:+ start:890 stop:1177 length:288 start_codon:yes stop_codon:yes gene_type:complete